MPLDDWPDLLPVVVSVLNTTPSEARGGVSPFEAFLGRRVPDTLDLVIGPRKGDLRDAAGVLDKVRPALERLRARLETVHAKVRDHAQARRQAREGYEPEFCEGDYVLYHDVHRHRNKPQVGARWVRWWWYRRGPRGCFACGIW